MRVITGTAKGRRLDTLEGMDVRPTADRVKEGMFSSIQFELENSLVLDLFGGSGQLGIEALSRGARAAVFVDNSKKSIEIIKSNLRKTGFEEKSLVFNINSEDFLKITMLLCGCMSTTVRVQRSEDNFAESSISLFPSFHGFHGK